MRTLVRKSWSVLALLAFSPVAWAGSCGSITWFTGHGLGPAWLLAELQHFALHGQRLQHALGLAADGQPALGWDLLSASCVQSGTPVTNFFFGNGPGLALVSHLGLALLIGISVCWAGLKVVVLARRHQERWRQFLGGQSARPVAHA